MKQNDIYGEWKEVEIIILNNYICTYTYVYVCKHVCIDLETRKGIMREEKEILRKENRKEW